MSILEAVVKEDAKEENPYRMLRALEGQSRHRAAASPMQEKPGRRPEATASSASASLTDGEK